MTARSRKYFLDKFIEKITYVPDNLSWLCEDCEPLGFCQRSNSDPLVYIDEPQMEETVRSHNEKIERGVY